MCNAFAIRDQKRNCLETRAPVAYEKRQGVPDYKLGFKE